MTAPGNGYWLEKVDAFSPSHFFYPLSPAVWLFLILSLPPFLHSGLRISLLLFSVSLCLLSGRNVWCAIKHDGWLELILGPRSWSWGWRTPDQISVMYALFCVCVCMHVFVCEWEPAKAEKIERDVCGYESLATPKPEDDRTTWISAVAQPVDHLQLNSYCTALIIAAMFAHTKEGIMSFLSL